MNRRFDAEAGQQVINLRETRKEIDKVYTDITERINAFALVDDENDYSDFINKLNERIVYFKNTLSIRKGRTGKVTKGEGQE
jgi:hypothetical protein